MRLLYNSTRRALFLATLLSLFACAESVRGQKPEPQTQQQESNDVVRVSTDLVQTDVTVLDREGRFMDGLARDQFVLLVDGKPVPISFFERVGAAAANASGAYPQQPRAGGSETVTSAGLLSEQRGRRIVFFLDDLHLAADSIAGVRRALLEFIEKEMRQTDEIAIVSASGQIGFLQQLTTHKGVLRAAVARLEPRRSTVVDAENLQLSEYAAYRISQGDKAAIEYYVNQYLSSLQFEFALPKYGRKGTPMMGGSDPAQAARMIGLRAAQILEESARLSAQTFDALENFLRSSAQTPGRKLVIFVSDGFFMDKRDAKYAYRMQRVTDAAARAGSVIYTVDARAFEGRAGSSRMKTDMTGRYDKFSAGEFTASQVGLGVLADATGGRAMLESKALASAVTSANQETFNYYLLAWRPQSEEQKVERFRQIEVSVANRPDLTVRVARGYLQANAKASTSRSDKRTSGPNIEVKSVAGDAMAASVASKSMLDTKLGLSYLDTPNNNVVLTASTKIGVDALLFGEDARQPAAVDLAGVVLNDRGEIASSFKTRVNVAAPSSATGTEEDRAAVIYNYRAPLAPGLYQVRVAARDDRTGRMGRAAEWIEIPNVAQGRLALSSLLLDAQVVETSEKSSGERTRARSQVQFSVDKLFRRGSRLNFLLFIYNAAIPVEASTGADLTAEIEVTRDGQSVMTLKEQKVKAATDVDVRRIPFSGSIELKPLAAGRYLLQVTVRDRSAKSSTVQQVEFRVE